MSLAYLVFGCSRGRGGGVFLCGHRFIHIAELRTMLLGHRSRLTRRIQSGRFIAKQSYHRWLRLETLEDRRVLAAIAKFDFNLSTSEPGPSGWTRVLQTDATSGVTDPSGIGLQFTRPFTTANATFVASTIPTDASGIRNGFRKTGLASDELSTNFVLTGLDSQKAYEVWVLGGNSSGTAQTQRVSVEGGQGITSFDQSISNLNL